MSAENLWTIPEPRTSRVVALALGLILFGFSLALMLSADLGLDSWDVFHQGVASTLGLRLGIVIVATSLVVLLLWIPLRQPPGPGTIANAVIVGLVFELAHSVLPIFESMLWRVLMLITAILLNALATGLYIGAGLGPGPRDGLMTGLASRGISIGRVRTGLEITVLVIGWALGGSVGVGTVAFALMIGPLVQLVLPRLTIRDPVTS